LSNWCIVNDGLMYANPLAMPVFSKQQHWHSHCHTKLYIHHSVTDNALVLVHHWSDGCRPDRAERVPACSRGAELPELAGARSGLRTMIPQFKADRALAFQSFDKSKSKVLGPSLTSKTSLLVFES
jgi:hypothetical protein